MLDSVGIIGGSGAVGSMFAQYLADSAIRLQVSDEQDLTQENKLVEQSELVIVSVPIKETPAVVRRIAPKLQTGQLLSDFTSVKTHVVPEMLKTQAAVISAHPLFGPTKNIQGQNILLLPARPANFLEAYRGFYEQLGLKVEVVQNWQTHDSQMALIQGLMHFLHIVFVQTLRRQKADIGELLAMCSPVYESYFSFSCRILDRDPKLYAQILLQNPANQPVVEAFLQEASQCLGWVKDQREDEFCLEFEQSVEFLGEHAKTFAEQSEFLVQQLQKYKTTKSKI